MPVALRRITPAVVQSIQVFFQVVLYAGLFIFAQYLVSWLHLPLPANLVGMILMLALIVCRILPLQWVRAGAPSTETLDYEKCKKDPLVVRRTGRCMRMHQTRNAAQQKPAVGRRYRRL